MRIPLNLSEVQESRPVPNGRYDLVIASAEEAKSKAGADQIKVSLGIEGHETAPNVSHYISLPGNGDEPQKANFKMLLLKRFLHAFSIPYDNTGFDIETFAGATAKCDLTLSEPDDSGNIYNRLQLPRLPSEGNEGTVRSTAARPPKR
jgi:Protein of unknown function (DUF669)